MSESEQLPVVGPWAQDKLSRLGAYLTPYTTILRQQGSWCRGYFYVDAFAGAGRAKIRASEPRPETQLLFEDIREEIHDSEAREAIDGSPRVALSVPFTQYFFVELDPERRKHLEKLKAEYPGRNLQIIGQDCNAYLERFIASHDWKVHRGVVFLDPFGMQVPWGTLEQIGRTEALEIIINFPVGMAIQRLLRRNGQFTAQERARLDEYLGHSSWFEALYKPSRGRSLFADEPQTELVKVEQSGERLVEWYQQRLAGPFQFVSSAYLVRNSKGGHLYYLIHAGPNGTGAKIAEHVLGGGQKLGAAPPPPKARDLFSGVATSEKRCPRCGSENEPFQHRLADGKSEVRCAACRDRETAPGGDQADDH